MSPTPSLRPLVDVPEQSADVRALLGAGIADEVQDYDFERGLGAHLAAIGTPLPSPPNSGAPAPAPIAPTAAPAVSAKALLGWLGVPIASATVAAALLFHPGGPKTSTVPPAVASHPRAEQPVVERQRTVAISRLEDLLPAPAPPSPASSGGSPAVAELHGSAVSPPGRMPSRASTNRLPAANAAELPAADLPEPAPRSDSPQAPRGTSVSGSSAEAASPVERDSTQDASDERDREREAAERRRNEERLEREMEDLALARRELSTDPAHALSLAQRGEREHPKSLFTEERRHIVLLALIGLGRVDEARRLSAPYLALHPDSPFAQRVRRALDAAEHAQKR